MKELKIIFIPGWGMEEGVWTLVLPYFKEYSVRCINWRNVKEQSEFAGRIIDVAKDENVIFLRKIVSGPSDQSYGIHVAKLAGIPRKVIERAKEILFNLEKKELDDSGTPKIAYRSAAKQDEAQFLLFQEDREIELLRKITNEILDLDLSALTPLQALNVLDSVKSRLKEKK